MLQSLLKRAEKYFAFVFGERRTEWLKWRLWKLMRATYLVGVFPVVFQNNEILLIRKRLGISGMGEWQLPGGGKKHGQSAEDAACVELCEETGITAHELQLVSVPSNELCHDLHILYLVTQHSGEVQVHDTLEISEAKFIPYSRALKLLSGDHREMAILARKHFIGNFKYSPAILPSRPKF